VVVAATVTDHVTPHKKNPHLFWDSANWQSLCKPCHETKTARIDGGAVLKPEWLKPPGGTVVLVCGPPASGKSTYVRERANRQDAIIDLDEIVAELSGVAAGAVAARVWWTRAIRERNRRLANLYGRPAGVSAWIVITGTAIDRKWWVEKLKPTEVVILAVPEHVCAARISGDPARVGVAAKQISAARRWWSLERAAEENRLSR
jgi:5-methylcytosine-specific restriction protein A